MQKRRLGKTGFEISEVSLGTWQLGTRWGDPFDAKEARNILESAVENGINFIDTADGYNAGMSEVAIGEFINAHKNDSEKIYVATKCGRGKRPHVMDNYTEKSIRGFVDASLSRMKLDYIDLLQLHCPLVEVFDYDETWETLKALISEGKIGHYGVSVETVDEGFRAIDRGAETLQVIFNMFRFKPSEELFSAAKSADVGIIVRVPLASGLLSGKFTKDSVFGKEDHRNFNRGGEAFDKGETFSGVDYETGLKAVEELKALFGTDKIAPFALRWILMFDAVSAVIPGASRTAQIVSNVEAGNLAPLTAQQMDAVKAIYDKYIKSSVHSNW